MDKNVIEDSLLEYSNKEKIRCDINKIFSSSIKEVLSLGKIPFSKISLESGCISTPFSKFISITNELKIYIFQRWMYPHTTKEERDFRLKYIINHEIREASLRKPNIINQTMTSNFNWLLPDPLELRSELSDESLILQCKNLVSDIKTDKELVTLNDDNKIGFLLAHNPNDDIDKSEMKLELKPMQIVFMNLSIARRACIARLIKDSNFKFGVYSTKFIGRYTGFNRRILKSSNTIGRKIYNELFEDDISWKSIYNNSIKLRDSLSKEEQV